MFAKNSVGLTVVTVGLIVPAAASAGVTDSVSVGGRTATLGMTQSEVTATFGIPGGPGCAQIVPGQGLKGPARLVCNTPTLDAGLIDNSAVILSSRNRDAKMNGIRVGTTERALKKRVDGLKCKTYRSSGSIDRTCTAGPSVKHRTDAGAPYPVKAGQVNNSYFLHFSKTHHRFEVTGFALVKRVW